jgi:hypothetical protein
VAVKKRALRRAVKPLSPKQRALLARAMLGEDRQIPERLHYEKSGRLSCVQPARRWYVPPGYLVVEGSAEYSASRALASKGLLKHDSVPQSPENPYGLGGYSITAKGKSTLV